MVRLSAAPDGATLVRVLGRAKSSLKLGNGKWVHPEALEDLYRGAAGVQLLFVHGDASHEHLVAVVDTGDDKQRSEAALLAEFHRLAAAANRPRHERISGVVVAAAPFSQENGMLNGTGKLVRRCGEHRVVCPLTLHPLLSLPGAPRAVPRARAADRGEADGAAATRAPRASRAGVQLCGAGPLLTSPPRRCALLTSLPSPSRVAPRSTRRGSRACTRSWACRCSA